MSSLNLLAAIRPAAAAQYRALLDGQALFTARIVTAIPDLMQILQQPDYHVDMLVLDNALDGAFQLVSTLRRRYPRLLIILIDEEADFSIPGRVDDVSTDPFTEDDLLRRIQHLFQERQMETLRADSLPSVRALAREFRQASGVMGKAEAAVEAIRNLGYDFVAYYRLEELKASLVLNATAGPKALTSVTPDRQPEDTLAGWVARNGQSRIVGPQDEPNFSLVKRGRLGAGACVPVGSTKRFGVLLACREVPDSISQENVLLLELICAQLAAALSQEFKL